MKEKSPKNLLILFRKRQLYPFELRKQRNLGRKNRIFPVFFKFIGQYIPAHLPRPRSPFNPSFDRLNVFGGDWSN